MIISKLELEFFISSVKLIVRKDSKLVLRLSFILRLLVGDFCLAKYWETLRSGLLCLVYRQSVHWGVTAGFVKQAFTNRNVLLDNNKLL